MCLSTVVHGLMINVRLYLLRTRLDSLINSHRYEEAERFAEEHNLDKEVQLRMQTLWFIPWMVYSAA